MFIKTVLVTVLIAAFASPAFAATRPHSPDPAWDVYVNGKYVGSDPDPFIRHQIMRENSGR